MQQDKNNTKHKTEVACGNEIEFLFKNLSTSLSVVYLHFLDQRWHKMVIIMWYSAQFSGTTPASWLLPVELPVRASWKLHEAR